MDGRGVYAFVFFCSLQTDWQVEELAALLYERLVEVDEVGPPLLVERAEVVLQIFEEWGVVVAGFQGIPMLALPLAVVADAHVFHGAFPVAEGAAVYGYGEVERSVGRVDGAAVAYGLLLVVFVLLNPSWFVS